MSSKLYLVVLSINHENNQPRALKALTEFAEGELCRLTPSSFLLRSSKIPGLLLNAVRDCVGSNDLMLLSEAEGYLGFQTGNTNTVAFLDQTAKTDS